MELTTVVLGGFTSFPSEESIKQLLRGVPGFRRVEQLIRSTRKLIIRHDNGKGSQIVEKLKEGYTIESDTTVTAE
ncbi:hypothetical protein SUGI_0103150 [Cryptomeria japonica]|nr:hypothetical protein SUGI_0103030 [Cryptomeria japonica]GLJ09176.1 hypothetical protein SUGI_0103150 [Cryptomeria japonica]